MVSDLDNRNGRILCQPFNDDLLGNPRLKLPYTCVLEFSGHDIFQLIQTSIVLADPLMQFQAEPSERSTILKLGLVVDIGRPESLYLYTT